MKTAAALVFATVVLAGCTASGDTMERLGVSATGATSQGPVGGWARQRLKALWTREFRK